MKTVVTICMLTFKRRELLREALLSLGQLSMSANPDIDLQFVLIDNDAARSGESVFNEVRGQLPFPARYVVEDLRGIVNARNRALKEAATADFIALVDDDETVDPSWIDQLVTVQRTFAADVITGPVFPKFENAPAWVVRGAFFAHRQQQTGEIVHFVETNNVLFRGAYARDFAFDMRFNMTSGEDTHFFMRLERAGAKIVWAADARVYETIPTQRTSAAWLLDRAHSDANRYTRALLFLSPGAATVTKRMLRAFGSLGGGIAVLLTSFGMRHRVVTGARLLWRFVGTTKALFGAEHTYYKPNKTLR